MKKLIEKHLQSNGKGRGVIYNPEAYILSLLAIPGTNTTSNTLVQQANQQARLNNASLRRILYLLLPDEILYTDPHTGKQSILKTKNASVSQDTRTNKLRKQDLSWAEYKLLLIRLEKAKEETAQAFNAMLERTLPSYWLGQATGEKPNAAQALVIDLISPSLITKGARLLGNTIKGVGKGIDYLTRMDMTRFGYTPTTKYYFKPGYLGMNGGAIGGASDKILFKSPAITVTLGTVNNFWNKVGNLSKEELIKLGYLRKGPAGLHIVIIDGKPMGSFERIYLPNKPKAELLETPILLETKPSIKMGEDRTKLLEAGWNKASLDILGMKSEVSPYIIKLDDPLALTLQLQAEQVRSTQGQIEQPFTNFYLNLNPKLSKLVERIAEGYDGIPRDASGNPMIITATDINGNPVNQRDVLLNSVLAYFDKNNASKANYYLTLDLPFMLTFRGSLPRLDPQTLLPKGDTPGVGTKAFGDLNFSTDNLLAATNYSHVLTPEQFLYVMLQMRKQGIPITRLNIDYGMSLVESIMKEQVDKGVKLGLFGKEFRTGLKVPRSSEARGAGETDARRMPSIFSTTDEPNPNEWSNYINNLIRYSRFFGPNQGHGGLRSVMIRRPQAIHKFDVSGKDFDKLGIEIDGKVFNTASDLLKHAAENYWKGVDLYNIKDPLPMNTYGTPLNYYFYGFGMKKGGKLIKRK